MAIPPILSIPENILSCRGEVKTEDNKGKLLTLPDDILLLITKHTNLSIFDRACLALTCKGFARIVLFDSSVSLVAHAGLGTINDENVADWATDGLACMRSDDDPKDERFEQALEVWRERLERVPEKEVRNFFTRMDQGWNRSKSRYCENCGMFRTVEKGYWNSKMQKYKYKLGGRMADAWRSGASDFDHDLRRYCEDTEEYIDRWTSMIKVDRGKPKMSKCSLCPECMAMEWRSRYWDGDIMESLWTRLRRVEELFYGNKQGRHAKQMSEDD